MGPIFSRLSTEEEKETFELPVSPEALRELIALFDAGKIRMNLLRATLEKMLDTGKPASAFLTETDLAGIDDQTLQTLCQTAVQSNEKAVQDFRAGKEKALKVLLGQIMKATKGRADAVKAESLIREIIANTPSAS